MIDAYTPLAEIPYTLSDGTSYPLLPGDVLQLADDGTFTKVAPGLCINGIVLDEVALKPIKFEWVAPLVYRIEGE